MPVRPLRIFGREIRTGGVKLTVSAESKQNECITNIHPQVYVVSLRTCINRFPAFFRPFSDRHAIAVQVRRQQMLHVAAVAKVPLLAVAPVPCWRRTAVVGSVKRPSPGSAGTGELRRSRSFNGPRSNRGSRPKAVTRWTRRHRPPADRS